ncbi:galanin-like peptide isoform X2 [Mustela erminea]|nr:galanin-like peptide isoform X2 [Mustela erminea]
MAPPVRLVLLLAILLSLVETPASVPVRQGRGGWTLNSVGYLLGPVLHLPQSADRGRKEKTALEVLDLWKAVDGLPHPRPRRASKRSLRENSAKPETAGEHGKCGGHRQEPGTGASSPSRTDSTPMLALTAPLRSTPPSCPHLRAQHMLPSQFQTFPHNLALM